MWEIWTLDVQLPREQPAAKPALSGTGCSEVAWNKESQKYLQWGTLNLASLSRCL